MRRPKHSLFVCTLLAIILVGVLGKAATPASEPANLSRVGTYTIGPAGLTHKYGGGVVVTVAPGSVLQVAPSTSVELRAGRPAARCATLLLASGQIGVSVPQKGTPTHSVLVRAPHKISTISLGGTSVVIANLQGTTVANLEGELVVGIDDDWKPFRAGMARSFTKESQEPPRPILGAPTVHVGAPLLFSQGGRGSIRAEVVGDAATEHVEVAVYARSEKQRKLVLSEDTPGGSVDVSGLAPGRYQIAARAVDRWGLRSVESAPVDLMVVGYELPAGATMQTGEIRLLPGQRIKILGAKGLEMTYGSQSNYFVAAPADVGLGRQARTVARFRIKGTRDEARLALALRPFSVEIAVNPPAPRWPADPVEVEVRVTDAQGTLCPEDPRVTKTVTIDDRPVQLLWRNDGGVLRAVLPAQFGAGPWIVRVEIGDEIGEVRSFTTQVRADERVATK